MLKRAAVVCLSIPLLISLSPAARADDAETAASPIVAAPGTVVVITPPSSVTAPLPPPDVESVPAAPPPQNEPWSNVSHINGVPVPVGERNRYLYDFKKTNLQVSPIGIMLGYYSVAASHAVSSNLALSVEVATESHDSGSSTASQVALTLPIYFKRTFSGPYIEPGFVARTESNGYDADCFDCGNGSSNTSFVQFEMMVGWSWMFDSGLNMSAAIGLARRLGNDADDCCDDGLAPAGYFRAGYAF